MSVGILNNVNSGANALIQAGNKAAGNSGSYIGRNGKTNGGGQGVMKCVAAGGHKVSLCQDALMSYASPQTGESVNIYKAENYSAENPLYVIKGLDADGNAFEEVIDAGKIRPNHCSFNELMVLNLETGHTSPSDYLHAVAVRDKAQTDSYFTKADYLAYAQAVMKDQMRMGNWASYLSYDKWIRSLMDYAGKRA